MHPALSVILFTTLSGAGYGLVALMGGLAAAGRLPPDPWLAGVGLGLGSIAIAAGLIASTFHLGRPERAWRAFSQWRSSWLSREGVLSLLTFLPILALAYGAVIEHDMAGPWAIAGVATALLAVATVYCTAMIYRSLKPIAHWHNGWVAPGYLLFAAMSGALWLNAILLGFGEADRLIGAFALLSTAAAAAVKLGYWRHIDGTAGESSAESATGLGRFGTVRLLEAPHTGENYLMREMGFRIARKHAAKLRRVALLAGFAAPALLTILAMLLPPIGAIPAAVLAALSAMLGLLVERWLFFAEAKHAVTLYYGAARA
ncbi:MAG: dimethyl sulfoxide reductase anchor subunit family protein [Dongiaceae bacterium]